MMLPAFSAPGSVYEQILPSQTNKTEVKSTKKTHAVQPSAPVGRNVQFDRTRQALLPTSCLRLSAREDRTGRRQPPNGYARIPRHVERIAGTPPHQTGREGSECSENIWLLQKYPKRFSQHRRLSRNRLAAENRRESRQPSPGSTHLLPFPLATPSYSSVGVPRLESRRNSVGVN